MHRHLVERNGYTGSYGSVCRFVKHLRPPTKLAVVRMESPPGQQAQVDFGAVGKLRDPQTGQERQAYCFVLTLSYSRHQYLEFVFDQSIATWIGCHRRAFESFGGAPREIVVDNLKAAVLKAALEDTILSAPYRQMAQHYGFLIHPCRVRTPQHKGKVENGIHYVQRNFLAGATYRDIREANQRGQRWVQEHAGVREHGTTREAPLQRFRQQEAAVLLPLPEEPFHLLEVRPVKVHRDCHVVLEGSYYSVSHTYIGQILEAHLYEKTVQLFAGLTLLATYERATQPGQRLTRLEHYPKSKAIYLERTPEWCRDNAARIGPACKALVLLLLSERPLDHLRAAQSLVGLEESVGAPRLEAACVRALHFGDPRYRRVKSILGAGLENAPLGEAALTPDAAPPPRTYTYARGVEEFFPSEEGQKEAVAC
jgi:transposase